ncbi:prepilin-type N-terminal cleavage/methylation domain-containing protein [uncultured Trichococcus sp.]|uniref:competence type IV pilus major pilin ComGC n=1 Tax=uncultured Trichococcus sp. TaxID=189665 RepID=UPI0029C8822E|nr:prepilin-type N-terminal cleavage/methylation domain-containing protein [uncultured Trichococcus sp.]
MRNKIKQLLKKEGGFTLVELLGVIVILGLIVGISIPLIGNVIDGAEEKTIAAQEELVIDAAQMYELGGGTIDATTGVTSTQLITAGYLEEQEDDAQVYTVTKTGKQYEIAAEE